MRDSPQSAWMDEILNDDQDDDNFDEQKKNSKVTLAQEAFQVCKHK